jgi:hypothetical protein
MPESPRRSLASLVALAAAALGSAPFGVAMAGDLDGLYVGGNYGRARSSYDTNFVASQLATAASDAGDGQTVDSSRVFRTSAAWWADLGYWFGPNVGMEAAFLHLGELKYRSTGSLATFEGTEPYVLGGEVSSRGPALSLVGRLPLTESLEVDARVGDYYGKTTLTTGLLINSQYTPSPQSTTGSSLLLGVGVGYTFGTHWSLRLDYLRIGQVGNDGVGKFDVNLPAVGFSFTF